MNVPVRVLKNQLSEYLRKVQQGRVVTVTDHGRPIATLGPLPDRAATAAERLARLVEDGEVTAPRSRGRASVKLSKVRGRPVSETLVEDRR
jgi:prevent-host-death family protein